MPCPRSMLESSFDRTPAGPSSGWAPTHIRHRTLLHASLYELSSVGGRVECYSHQARLCKLDLLGGHTFGAPAPGALISGPRAARLAILALWQGALYIRQRLRDARLAWARHGVAALLDTRCLALPSRGELIIRVRVPAMCARQREILDTLGQFSCHVMQKRIARQCRSSKATRYARARCQVKEEHHGHWHS
jgi:hypothetical protein